MKVIRKPHPLRPDTVVESEPPFNPTLPVCGIRLADATKKQVREAVEWYRARARTLLDHAEQLLEAFDDD